MHTGHVIWKALRESGIEHSRKGVVRKPWADLDGCCIVVELRLRELRGRVVGVVDELGSGVDVAERLAEEERGDGDGADGEVARGAKDGVEKDRDKGAVKAVHGGQAREERVRHALRHDHEADGNAGCQVHEKVLLQLHSARVLSSRELARWSGVK